MIRTALVVALPALAATSSVHAVEMPKTAVSMETCMQAALAAKPGKVTHLKLEVERGVPIYEFDIRTASRQTWEVECDANTGQILALEREVDRNDQTFQSAARITERDARRIALARFPGKVTDSDLELDQQGRAIIEVEIERTDGTEVEVKVDATNGQIVSTEDESQERSVYRIGED